MPYLIVYDDCGIRFPMTWDKHCEGAVCAAAGKEPIVIFPSHAAARRAVTISARFAALEKAQDKPYNSEFLTRGQVEIIPTTQAPEPPCPDAK